MSEKQSVVCSSGKRLERSAQCKGFRVQSAEVRVKCRVSRKESIDI